MTDQQYERLKQICAARGIKLPPKPEPYKRIDPNMVKNAYRECERFAVRTALIGSAVAALFALPLLLIGANAFLIQAVIYATGGLVTWLSIRRFRAT